MVPGVECIRSWVQHIHKHDHNRVTCSKNLLFFRETGQDYVRFNYIGEWHSHPLFEPYSSRTDDLSMLQIVQDGAVGANFVVLLITKLGSDGELISTAHTYLPDGVRMPSIAKIEL